MSYESPTAHPTKTFAYVGTYSDGVTRSGHVTTNDLPAWKSYMMQGVLPFASIVTRECTESPFTCDCTETLKSNL